MAGTLLARAADRLADRTGLGEALVGGFLLAGATSLPDFAATLSAAMDGRPQLAMSNIMGSMAANLMFLGIADIIYRKANLEHAAASTGNLTQAALLIALLAVVMVAAYTPVAQAWRVHPATILITFGYLYGVTLVHRTQASPMWFPKRTAQTVEDVPDRNSDRIRLSSHWLQFTALSITTGAAGWVLMESAKVIADLTVLSDSIAGGLLTAVVTSTPELVTTIAAVRRGALTLALSNIVGTNGFNVLVIAMADVGYRQGSIYHDIAAAELTWGLTVILMTAVLLLGMVQRQTRGIGNIGFESLLILSIYVVAVLNLLA